MVTSNVKEVSQTRRELTLNVPADVIAEAIESALVVLGQQVRVPGFRPGKVPAKLARRHVGEQALVDEAFRQGINEWLGVALEEHSLSPVAQPSVDVKVFNAEEGAEMEIIIDILPEIKLPKFDGMKLDGPEWELKDEDVDQALDQLRERFAEVETVDRGVQAHDLVTLTIEGKLDGEVVPEASAKDLVFQVPDEESDSVMDTAILGVKAGESFDFTDELGPEFGEKLAGKTLDFHCTISEVKQRNLPELDDDFALSASEFDTIAELREDLKEDLAKNKIAMAHANRRAYVVASITEELEYEVPLSLIDHEVRHQLNVLAAQAERSGLDFNQFLAMAGGGDIEALMNRIREEAEATVRAQIFVDAVAREHELAVENDDLTAEIVAQARRLGRDPQEIADVMFSQENVGAVYTDALRRKAIDFLMEKITITNEPPALETLQPAEEAADDAKEEEKPKKAVKKVAKKKADEADDKADEKADEAKEEKPKKATKSTKTTKAKKADEDKAADKDEAKEEKPKKATKTTKAKKTDDDKAEAEEKPKAKKATKKKAEKDDAADEA